MLWVLLCAAALTAQGQPGGLTATLELDQQQYLPDEDLLLKITILNRSGQPVVLGATKDWLTVEVNGENQNVVPKNGEMPVLGPFTLLSGQTVTREFNPAPYFDCRKPDRYSLGATLKVPQWKKEIPCKPILFIVAEGLPLTDLGDLTVGLPPPPGVTNTASETRRYSLLKVSYPDQMKLYFRLTDGGGRTLRVFPLARTVSFGDPEAQIDRANNLHVLFQTGAHTFAYCVIDARGDVLVRQVHEYTNSRPKLHLGDNGMIFVGGGRRLVTLDDIPAPAPRTARSQ